MSPSSSTQQPQGVKRKKPPTFQHLPAQRAKKLKQSWVEVQKIKSKWKAQKRKEGLVASRSQLEREVGADEDPTRESDEEEDKESVSGSSDAGEGGEETGEEDGDEMSDAEQSSVEQETPQTSTRKGKSVVERRHPKTHKPVEQPSLRELQNKAYSRSSLHTHKSDPLHRHKGGVDPRGRGRGRGRGGEGSGLRGRGRGRGRGQPDMGLRMKAMLEKIKQDYS